jgi:Ca2+-binding EF-hand superfamily protein
MPIAKINNRKTSNWCRIYSGAFRLYDVDNDGYITRSEMYNIVDAIYQMVVSRFITIDYERVI